MKDDAQRHGTKDNDTAIADGGNSPTRPAKDDEDCDLVNDTERRTPAAVITANSTRTLPVPGASFSHELLRAKAAIGSPTARSTDKNADRAKNNTKKTKNKVVRGATSHHPRSYAFELFVDDDAVPDENEEEQEASLQQQEEYDEEEQATTTKVPKKPPMSRHDLLLQAKSRIRSRRHHQQQQHNPVRNKTAASSATIRTATTDDADQKQNSPGSNNHLNVVAVTTTTMSQNRTGTRELVEWNLSPPNNGRDPFSVGDVSHPSELLQPLSEPPPPPLGVEDYVYRGTSRSVPSLDSSSSSLAAYEDRAATTRSGHNVALTAVVVEDPPSFIHAVVVNINKRRKIIGTIVLCTLVVIAALVTALTLTAAQVTDDDNDQVPTMAPTVATVDDSEWVTIVNNFTLSGKTMTYPPPESGASVEERALAWLIDVEVRVPWRNAVQHYAFVVLALEWNNTEWHLEAGFDECDLPGITCDSVEDDDDDDGSTTITNGTIRTCIAMDLPSAELQGTIPADIGLLTNLRTIDLYRNFLSGTVPWEPMLQYMSHLESLSLNDNYFSGPLPAPWNGTWPALVTFWTDWNGFSGTISPGYAHWPSLEDFSVAQNKLVGTVPSELGRISSLRTFAVFSNKMSGSIPTEIGAWSLMEYFDIEGNRRMNGTIPTELGQWTRLIDFYCHDNLISGSIPTEIGRWTNAAVFQAESNRLTGSIPTELENWTNMRTFFIDNNDISGPLPAGIGNWTYMDELRLHNNRLSGAVPIGVTSWAKLSAATFQGNELAGSLEELCTIAPPDAIVSADSCELYCPCCVSSFDDDDSAPEQNCTIGPESP